MKVSDIMSDQVRVVIPTLDAEDAWQYMQAEQIRHLVVIDEDRVAGILSERDLGGAHGGWTRADKTVADLMTPQALTIEPDADVREVARLMRGLVIGCFPVVDHGELVGIVTTSDLLDLLAASTLPPARRPPLRLAARR
jgi:CBS domain-containing protein